MKQAFKIILVLISAFITISSFAQDITGQWNGLLEIQGMQLRIVFHISQDGANYSATMVSPDQGATGIPVKEVSFKDSILNLEIPGINFNYSGKVKDSNKIEGNFTQHGSSYPLNLERGKVEKRVINRPQEPAPPFPYYTEDVKFKNEKDSILLAGTLSLPEKEGKFPAVILISGSGPQNRNEEIFNHKPFLVLADHLTKNGIAVLRFDDRGVGGSTGDLTAKATSEDFATDVLAGIDLLKSRKEIQHKRIGLIGHSEGGIIAQMIASENNDVAFIVLLAGPGTTGEEILISQLRLIGGAEGQENLDEKVKIQKSVIDIVKSENDKQKAEKELKALLENEINNLSEEEKKQIGNADEFIQSQIDAINSDWFRFFLTYDPKPVLKKVKCPVLAIVGEKDLQVPPKENLEAIGEALKAGGNKDYTIKELPGLNHLFQTAETGSVSEYGEIEETFSPLALNEISNWILKYVKR